MIKYHSLKMKSAELKDYPKVVEYQLTQNKQLPPTKGRTFIEYESTKYFLPDSGAKRPATANSTQHSVLSKVNWLVVEE